MSDTMWLIQRSILAVVLMVGFYVLALAIAGLLLWLPVAQAMYSQRVSVMFAIGCLASALTILVSVIPRRDRFEPPGLPLDAPSEPRLFELLESVAARMNQRMPDEVYMIPVANAWVAQRGGIIGFGGRRVLGIGYPLLQAMPSDEMRAILAHEFGHFASNDVRLGPWIYGTRKAIGQTLHDLEDSWLGLPFHWYSQMFLRLTHAVSRRQEIVADRVAADLAGAPVLASALRRVNAVEPAFQVYFEQDVLPVLQAGFLPPIAEGFDRYLQSTRHRRVSTLVVAAAESKAKADPHDTHPPLRERLEALGCGTPADLDMDREPAVRLLRDPGRYAGVFLRQAFGDQQVNALTPIEWPDVVRSVYVAHWKAATMHCGHALAAFTFEAMPMGREAFLGVAARLGITGFPEKRLGLAARVVGGSLATRLIAEGWQPELVPSESLVFRKDGQQLEPFFLAEELATGAMTPEQWRARRESLGLAGPLLPPDLLEPAAAIRRGSGAALAAGERRHAGFPSIRVGGTGERAPGCSGSSMLPMRVPARGGAATGS